MLNKVESKVFFREKVLLFPTSIQNQPIPMRMKGFFFSREGRNMACFGGVYLPYSDETGILCAGGFLG